MPRYLIRLLYSQPASADEKARFVEREMEISSDEVALGKAAEFIKRERMLDNSVIGALIFKKGLTPDVFELVGEINLKKK